jgi:hypothetical protein
MENIVIKMTLVIIDTDIQKYLNENPTKTVEDLTNEINNICYLGMDCMNAISERTLEMSCSDYYVHTRGQ